MKKKKLLYNGLATLEKGHLLTAMYFAFYGLRNRPGHRGKVAGQITGWETCRESVANLVRNSLADGPYNIKGIAMNATKILVMLRNRKEKPEEAEKRAGKIIKRGVRILNIFEKEMGWRYTVPFRVPVEECPGTFLYAINGPKEWIASPHLLSIFLLLLRVGRYELFDRIRTVNGFVKKCGKMGTMYMEGDQSFYKWPSQNAGTDIHSLYNTAYKMLFFLRNKDRLYGKINSATLYKKSEFSEGFTNLCNNRAIHKEVRKRFKELCAECEIEDRKTLHQLVQERSLKQIQERQRNLESQMAERERGHPTQRERRRNEERAGTVEERTEPAEDRVNRSSTRVTHINLTRRR